MARAAACVALVWLAGCSAVLKFHECDQDSDCTGTGPDGGTLYCTDDHMCVGAVPDYRLCKVAVPSDGNIPPGALVVGGLYRVSAPNGGDDHTFVEAANLAANEFRAAGYNVAHVVCDTAENPTQAARAYDVVLDRFGAQVCVGPSTSPEVKEVAARVMARGVPIISPSATNPGISGLLPGLIWRTAASDDLQAKVLATLPSSSSVKLDLIYESDNLYATGLRDAFVAAFAALTPSGSVNAPLGYAEADGSGMNAAVTTAAGDGVADALLIADPTAPVLLAAVAKANGLANAELLMADGAKKPALWSQLNGSYAVLARVHGTGPANPDPSDPSGLAFAVLRSNFKAAYGEDPADTAYINNTYDAFYTAAFAALSLSGDKRTEKSISANIARMSDTANGQKVVVGANGITAGVTTLAAGGTIDLVGTSGPIDFDPATGDVLSAPIEKWSVVVPTTSGAMPSFKTDAIVVP